MKKSHNWVTLENPRNGKIQIRACSDCGAMKMSSAHVVSECKPRATSTRPLAGWKQKTVQAEA
ncbi:MAG: hypothetical protein KTR16_04695 [Acidiferrobacterales bacterium]|nr:hypothetical protein [Acidiferrobacterales bacterium]